MSVSVAHTGDVTSSNSDDCEHKQALRRHVQLSDRRLAEIADHVTRHINWGVLRSSVALWDKKRKTPYDHAFAMYTRKGRDVHYLMTTGVVVCSLVEMRNILRTTTDKQYAAMMNELYGDGYIYGSIAHRACSNHCASYIPSSTEMAFSSSEDTGCDLLVKTVTFTKPHVFARNEQWCFLEHFQLQGDADADANADGADVAEDKGFVLTMHSLDPDDVFVGKTKASVNHLQEMTAAYSVALADPNSCRRGVRVSFYAQIAVKQKQSNGTREAGMIMPQVKNAASKSTVTSRLTQMAKATSRLPMIVRRRRLGAQVYVDSKSIIPTNTRCICCTKSLHLLTKKKKCHLCGYFVCEKCSITHTMPRSRLKKYVVRVCEHCMERVDEANYDHIPAGCELSPPRIKPNDPNDSPAGKLMTTLLFESLESASELRKKAVKKVVKYLLEEEQDGRTKKRTSSATSTATWLTDQSPESEYVKALETQVHVKETPLDDIKLANATKRKYLLHYDESNKGVPKFPVPKDEKRRLSWIEQRPLKDLKDLPELKLICSIASQELQCSVGLVSVIDSDSMHVLAATDGFTATEFPREQVFCSHTIMSNEPLLIPHPEADINYSRLDVVQGDAGLRFYFGVPLEARDGTVIGTVCCLDAKPRDVTQAQFATVTKLAKTASKLLQAHVSSDAYV
uniref:FYVE-type domain-containing protein n=1 Tax=Globisporangium ultimum (strain ATCC 200006 / CBS 805.95 / DAOM BR144) TaxID=431595 RepID=K3W8F5_GLOUD